MHKTLAQIVVSTNSKPKITTCTGAIVATCTPKPDRWRTGPAAAMFYFSKSRYDRGLAGRTPYGATLIHLFWMKKGLIIHSF